VYIAYYCSISVFCTYLYPVYIYRVFSVNKGFSKLEVRLRNVSQRRQRKTEPRPEIACAKIGEDWTCSSGDMLADRQGDSLISLFRPSLKSVCWMWADDERAVLHRQGTGRRVETHWSRRKNIARHERQLKTHPVTQVAVLRQRVRNALLISRVSRLQPRHLWPAIQV